MRSIASSSSQARIAALEEERSGILENMQDLIDEATHHATVGRMDRWAETRQRISAEAERLAIVNQEIAALELGRGSRAAHLPARTSSWAVER